MDEKLPCARAESLDLGKSTRIVHSYFCFQSERLILIENSSIKKKNQLNKIFQKYLTVDGQELIKEKLNRVKVL
jgi:hypothetical protein